MPQHPNEIPSISDQQLPLSTLLVPKDWLLTSMTLFSFMPTFAEVSDSDNKGPQISVVLTVAFSI